MADTGYSTATQNRNTAAGEGRRPMRRTFTEAKSGFKTTEFFVMLAFIAGVLIATYSDSDSLARADGWRYASLAVAAYIVSRGLAKLGTRQPVDDAIDLN
jgi:hypothetical protein